jgi:hypothetical protein
MEEQLNGATVDEVGKSAQFWRPDLESVIAQAAEFRHKIGDLRTGASSCVSSSLV